MHSFYRLVTLFVFVTTLISCVKKAEPNFVIKGSILPLKGGTITLLKEIDIERKLSEEIDVINLSKEGEFEKGYSSGPGLYRLQLNKKKEFTFSHRQWPEHQD